jgi:S-adenosylmethionine:tRNA ribosyltransferase-isomerase
MAEDPPPLALAGPLGPDHDIASYDFDLPEDLVAQQPLPERDASRLLVLERAAGRLAHRRFRDLPGLLEPGDLLITNRSRVFKARLLGERKGGGAAEILLVRRLEGDSWLALVRPGRRVRAGAMITIAPGFAVRVETDSASTPAVGTGPLRRVRLVTANVSAADALDRYGHVPLPPYIRRAAGPADLDRYQTVYARESGSVAAPTAGLHFTDALFAALAARGVETASLVLHVGPGTFRPVEVADVRRHRVDPEPFTVPVETAAAYAQARSEGRRVVAVGTTVARALETALRPEGRLAAGDGETDLVVVPGFRFRAVDALVTNFHLPRSSLLLLVSAFAGRESTLAAYRAAVAARYRFYSYGDAMLVL